MKHTATPLDLERIHQTIAAALREQGDVRSSQSQAQYLKHTVLFHGLKMPELRSATKTLAGLWKEWDDASRVELAWQLLSSEYFEEKDVGISILKKVKSLNDAWLQLLEERFPSLVNNWAVCDGLCGGVLRPLLAAEHLRRRIVSWKDSSSPWLQRAAAVTFVNEAKRGLYNDDILAVCRATVRNPDRFVQLGTGWVLRELSLADRPLVNQFILEHRGFFIPEGLRYALEKHPAEERVELTAKR